MTTDRVSRQGKAIAQRAEANNRAFEAAKSAAMRQFDHPFGATLARGAAGHCEETEGLTPLCRGMGAAAEALSKKGRW